MTRVGRFELLGVSYLDPTIESNIILEKTAGTIQETDIIEFVRLANEARDDGVSLSVRTLVTAAPRLANESPTQVLESLIEVTIAGGD